MKNISTVLCEEQGRVLHDIEREIEVPRTMDDTGDFAPPASAADWIRKVAVLGAGTMGTQIACVCAVHGLAVTLHDVSPEALGTAAGKIENAAGRMKLYEPFEDPDAMAHALASIRYATDPAEAAQDVDLVSESVPEDPRLKARVFGQFHAVCPERTLFTTNTSSLLPSRIAEATGRPDRFCCLHFHDVFHTRTVDVMPHPGAARQTIATVAAFARRIGQSPIVMQKEHGGYVFNSMLIPLLQAALDLAVKEVAAVADIDRAFMAVMRTKVGPFGLIDSIGLDTAWKVTANLEHDQGAPEGTGKAAFLKTYIDRGKLGVKSGEGFYSYPSPLFLAPDFLFRSEQALPE